MADWFAWAAAMKSMKGTLFQQLALGGIPALALTLAVVPLQAQRSATARAEIGTNGTVTALTVLDPGSGYDTPPAVVLGGGGGSNALAQATLTNGAVAGLVLVHGGAGYTNPPSVGIAPPNGSVASLGARPGVGLAPPQIEVFGELGATVALQVADDVGSTGAWRTVETRFLTNTAWALAVSEAGVRQRFYRGAVVTHERPAAPEDMVWLPPGTFRMGSTLADPDFVANEAPRYDRP
jgi:hypothetical protein